MQPRAAVWLDPVLLVSLALAAGATFALAPLPAALGVSGVLLLLIARVPARVVFAALGALLLGALVAERSLTHFDAARQAARDALGAPERCALRGEVDAQPTRSGEHTLFSLSVRWASCEQGRVAPGTRVRLTAMKLPLARGDTVFAIAQLAPLELSFNAELTDPLPFAAHRGVLLTGTALALELENRGRGPLAAIDRFRARVRERIFATYAPQAQGMARALVLGENDLDPDDATAFRLSGLSHMLAVSGTHLVFAVVALVRALTALLVRFERLAAGRDVGRFTAAVGVVIALVYADFAGGSGSAWRAAYMLTAAFAARALGRTPHVSRALGWSVLIGWLRDPLVAFDVSFLLSFAATAGLVVLGKPLSAPCEKLGSRVSRALGTGIATTFAAMIPCAPLLALLGAELTLAGVFANVIAGPVGETVALPLCLLHALASGLPALEAGVGTVASGALLVVRAIAHESADQRWLALPLPDPNAYQLALAAVLAAAIVLCRGHSGWQRAFAIACLGGLGLVELAIRTGGAPHGVLRVTSLAVGQGDSTLIDLPDGRLALIDGGGAPSGGADPGARVVVPMLRARRRSRIDVVVITHPHPDHFGGILAVLRAVEVGELWDSGQGLVEGAGPVYAKILEEARARGIPVRTPAELCKAPRRFGGAELRVLAPCPSYKSGRGANDNSLVLRIAIGRRAFLWTGDAEAAAEADLLVDPQWLRADVLKAGHHGSRTSSTLPFVSAVAPQYAVLSCGARNRFGHPSPEVVTRFEDARTLALRTDRNGSILFQSDGTTLDVRTARPPGRERSSRHSGVEPALALTPHLQRGSLRPNFP